jgi:hypothetical protein
MFYNDPFNYKPSRFYGLSKKNYIKKSFKTRRNQRFLIANRSCRYPLKPSGIVFQAIYLRNFTTIFSVNPIL